MSYTPRIVMLALCLLVSAAAGADEVLLTEGSRLHGQVQRLGDGKMTIKTDFAGDLSIDVAKVQGITTQGSVIVQTKAGERATGKLSYDADAGQRVLSEGLGPQVVPVAQMTALWTADQLSPEALAVKNAAAKWTLRLEAGLDGQSGNTERVAVNGRVEANRTTDRDRLKIFAQGRYAKENGVDTVREIIGGTHLEVDLTDRVFAFGRFELENDKFEMLDLRSTVTGGLGYWLLRQPDQELKVRAGAGYEFESFTDGSKDDQAIGELGADYRLDLAPWLRFVHATTYQTAFDDPTKSFRIIMENAGEIPLNETKDWKLRIGVRNQYDNEPLATVKRLDTYYFFNIVWDWH